MAGAQGHTHDGARPRRLICERCGAAFACALDGQCWCAHEAFRLPLPKEGATADAPKDCLCPACLRARARRMSEVFQDSGRARPLMEE